jgi:hypothetical protein
VWAARDISDIVKHICGRVRDVLREGGNLTSPATLVVKFKDLEGRVRRLNVDERDITKSPVLAGGLRRGNEVWFNHGVYMDRVRAGDRAHILGPARLMRPAQ